MSGYGCYFCERSRTDIKYIKMLGHNIGPVAAGPAGPVPAPVPCTIYLEIFIIKNIFVVALTHENMKQEIF